LRHLAAGKPLTAACNPLIEAFHALNQSHAPQDEAMLVRLYPFLCSRQVQQAMREMAASAGDAPVHRDCCTDSLSAAARTSP
jgi:site-specific recombinase XerC